MGIQIYVMIQFVKKKINMGTKCQNHRLQTNPQHYEEETQIIDSHNTIEVKQPSLSSLARLPPTTKLEKT